MRILNGKSFFKVKGCSPLYLLAFTLKKCIIDFSLKSITYLRNLILPISEKLKESLFEHSHSLIRCIILKYDQSVQPPPNYHGNSAFSITDRDLSGLRDPLRIMTPLYNDYSKMRIHDVTIEVG
ncbi:hypothetical protein ROZALSC1DRAFT_25713 [Rozella allomycis CSF55]|uniref:Uncharacterized protein n=1 Tax=Rozella allomycis (strain CSF55) TaxID=988480 RepID=A0A4P9YBV4_ROZAC|nr:hypothetical protein ROZALSC1DRAFT_25713 [Rozella allomycis CSF55]